MSRPKKQSVEYFPHFTKGGRTIYILESKYGNDGYAFWFKLLEILGEAEGHFYDCSNGSNWAYLLAKTRCSEDIANDIIKTLVELGKIDGDLWEKKRLLWVDNFVKNLSEVYRTRHTDLPLKPIINAENPVNTEVLSEKTPEDEVFSTRKPTKEKESKEKKRKYPYGDIVRLWNSICVSLPMVQGLSDSRKDKIRSRLDEIGDEEKWLPTIEDLFKRIQASDFLCGRNGRWKANFDWVFKNDKNYVKILEGNYTNAGEVFTPASETPENTVLGVGERIENGRRTYGTGAATIPMSAPPRPSEKYSWNAENQSWIIL